MTRIHMQTERVQDLARQMDAAANDMLHSQQQLRKETARLAHAWQGSRRGDQYASRMEKISARLASNLDQLAALAAAANREASQWLQADADGVGRVRRGGQSQRLDSIVNHGGPLDEQTPWCPAPLPIFRPVTSPKGHTAYFLQRGEQYQYYEGELELVGDLTDEDYQEASDFIKDDPFKRKLVKGTVTFYDEKAAATQAVFDSQGSSQYGDYRVSAFRADESVEASLKYGEGKFSAEAKGELGLYAGKAEYSKDFGALDVAAAGMVGATVAGTVGSTFDPSKGRVGAKAEVDAFAGGKVEGSASLGGEVLGVDTKGTVHGALQYGIGANAKADIGYNEGSFKAEVKVGACVGLGAEVGFSVNVNVQEAAENVIDAGAHAFEWASQALERL